MRCNETPEVCPASALATAGGNRGQAELLVQLQRAGCSRRLDRPTFRVGDRVFNADYLAARIYAGNEAMSRQEWVLIEEIEVTRDGAKWNALLYITPDLSPRKPSCVEQKRLLLVQGQNADPS